MVKYRSLATPLGESKELLHTKLQATAVSYLPPRILFVKQILRHLKWVGIFDVQQNSLQKKTPRPKYLHKELTAVGDCYAQLSCTIFAPLRCANQQH